MKAPCGPSEVSVEHVAWCGHLPSHARGRGHLHTTGYPNPSHSPCKQTLSALQVCSLAKYLKTMIC